MQKCSVAMATYFKGTLACRFRNILCIDSIPDSWFWLCLRPQLCSWIVFLSRPWNFVVSCYLWSPALSFIKGQWAQWTLTSANCHGGFLRTLSPSLFLKSAKVCVVSILFSIDPVCIFDQVYLFAARTDLSQSNSTCQDPYLVRQRFLSAILVTQIIVFCPFLWQIFLMETTLG